MRPLNVSLEGLIALVTVAQEGSLLRGRRTLGLGKSAVGNRLRLEEAVGTPLFGKLLRHEAKVEALLVGMAFYAAEAFGKVSA
jgi:DNA-binding transcriptional LysR family regulator